MITELGNSFKKFKRYSNPEMKQKKNYQKEYQLIKITFKEWRIKDFLQIANHT